jgi:uncharacterized integral membrane protein (TIGR00698 family)
LSTPPSKPDTASARAGWRAPLFIAAGAASLWPWEYAAQAALLAGVVLALLGLTAFEAESKKISRILIQVCVVMLGLRLDLAEMWEELRRGGMLAVATVVGTLVLGLGMGRLLRSERDVSLLVSSGTAICGGSAIAAVGASIRAAAGTMAVATGAIFILNAVGLFVLPWIGREAGLTADQFGAWAGIALHDIASVGAAGKAFGGSEQAAHTAMIVKLTRVVWITPIALLAARYWPRGEAGAAKSPFPWFILGFLAASGLATLVPSVKASSAPLMLVKDSGFQLALFLIGSGLSRAALARVGWRALVQATGLWIVVAAAGLWAVKVVE